MRLRNLLHIKHKVKALRCSRAASYSFLREKYIARFIENIISLEGIKVSFTMKNVSLPVQSTSPVIVDYQQFGYHFDSGSAPDGARV